MKTLELKMTDDMQFRAAVYTRDDADAPWTLQDLYEADDPRKLRNVVKNAHDGFTHYRCSFLNVNGDAVDSALWGDNVNAWSEALDVLKGAMQEWAKAEGVSVARNANPTSVVEQVVAQRAAVAERERLDAERDAERAQRKADHAALAAERADFDTWAQNTRANHEYGSTERGLLTAVDEARKVVAEWPALVADQTAKLAEHPTHTLSWSGSFVEAASKFEVAKWLVNAFEAGAFASDLADEAMRNVFRMSSNVTSRSTSVMSNLVDDCNRVAWTKLAERLTGRNAW